MAIYNIVKDYRWTVVDGARDKVPRIMCRAWEQDENAIFRTVKGYVNTAFSASGETYYDGLHKKDKNVANLIIPFFSDEVRGLTNGWGDTYVGSTNGSQAYGSDFVGVGKSIAESTIGTISQMAGMFTSSGALFEPPKFYTYGVSDNALTVEFSLINTYDEGDVGNNFALVRKLIELNRFERKASTLSKPPVLWEVTVPGYRYITWASCNVTINLIGRREMIGAFIVPEGYRVSLSFTSLYTEPSNLMGARSFYF